MAEQQDQQPQLQEAPKEQPKPEEGNKYYIVIAPVVTGVPRLITVDTEEQLLETIKTEVLDVEVKPGTLFVFYGKRLEVYNPVQVVSIKGVDGKVKTTSMESEPSEEGYILGP